MFIYEHGLGRKGVYIDQIPARTIHVCFQNTEETASSVVHLPKMCIVEHAYGLQLVASKGAEDGGSLSDKLYLSMTLNRVAGMLGEGSTCYNGNE
jgi:hypothetical protein